MGNNAKFHGEIAGDAVLGDKRVVYEAALLPLEKAILAIEQSIKDNPDLETIIEELAEYTNDRPGREVIGVEGKLIRGNREDLIEQAIYLKNKFERMLAKRQMSLVEQKVYVHVLATIETCFNQKIRPLIIEKQAKSVVDKAVQDHIVDPVYQSIVGYNCAITTQHVLGMLYFLTGKCHLLWTE
jgi:hypothetical protein